MLKSGRLWIFCLVKTFFITVVEKNMPPLKRMGNVLEVATAQPLIFNYFLHSAVSPYFQAEKWLKLSKGPKTCNSIWVKM